MKKQLLISTLVVCAGSYVGNLFTTPNPPPPPPPPMPGPAQLAVKIPKAAVGKPATIREWLELGRDLLPEASIRKIEAIIAEAEQPEEMKSRIIETIVKKSAATQEKKEIITQGLEQFWKDARDRQKRILQTMPEIACKALGHASNPEQVAGLVGVWTSIPDTTRNAYMEIKITPKTIKELFNTLSARM